MVRLFIFSSLLLSTSCKGQSSHPTTADQIRIEHRGPIDKPIIPLVISMEKLALPITELSIQVDQNTFNLLTEYFKSGKHLSAERKVNEFGVFQITLQMNKKVTIFYTPERIESIQLFKELLSQLEGKESSGRLVTEIKRILARIDFD
jgi:hypothetical protein